jgi:metal-responsive CopG/Arc/MetJ family transcriptional regulator
MLCKIRAPVMTSRANKTVTTSLPQDELAEFDRVREAHHLTRSQALREAIRQYIAAGTRRIPVVDPEPGEIEAIARGEEAIARGEYVTLGELLHELDADRREGGATKS